MRTRSFCFSGRLPWYKDPTLKLLNNGSDRNSPVGRSKNLTLQLVYEN